VSTRSLAECEQHYLGSHYVWARAMLEKHPAIAAYRTALAVSRFGPTSFGDAPTRWRYVLLRRHPGVDSRFDPAAETYIAEDHRNFLQDWRGFTTSETGQPPAEGAFTCLLEAWSTDDPDGLFGRVVDALAEGLESSILHRVISESGAESIDLPGQRPMRQPLPTTEAVAFALIAIADIGMAERWLKRADVAALLAADPRNVVHEIVLTCAFDEI
jgi:hypothetical protein